MADGFAALDAHVARLRSLADLPRAAAPACAEAIEDELKAQIGRGEDPDGRKWAPRKEDGGKPLETAADALTVVPVGTVVFCRLKGHIARHDKGTARGNVTRVILPKRGLPNPMVRALQRATREQFEKTMGVR